MKQKRTINDEIVTKENIRSALRQHYLNEDSGFDAETERQLISGFYYTKNENSLNNFNSDNAYVEGRTPYFFYIKELKNLGILEGSEAHYKIFSDNENISLEKLLGNFTGLKELDAEIFEKWLEVQAEYETEVVKYLAGREVYEYYSYIEDLKPEEMPEKFKEYYAPYLDNMNPALKKAVITEIDELLTNSLAILKSKRNEIMTGKLKTLIKNFYEKGAEDLPKFINNLRSFEIIDKETLQKNKTLEEDFNAEQNSYFFKKSKLILNNKLINLEINQCLAKKAVLNKGSELKKRSILIRKLNIEEILSDNELIDSIIGVPLNHEFFSSEEMLVLVTAINYLNYEKYGRKIEESENILANLLIGKTLYLDEKNKDAPNSYEINDNNTIFLSKIIKYNKDMFPQNMNNFWIENYDKKYELIKCLPDYFNSIPETEDASPSITGEESLEEEAKSMIGSMSPEIMAELKNLKAAENAKKLIIPKESELSEKPAKLSSLQQEILDKQKEILGEKNEQ